MGISPSSYYYNPRKNRVLDDLKLKDRIEKIQLRYPYYGYRRLHVELIRSHGEIVNHKRLKRVMSRYGLYSILKRKFTMNTTDSNHRLGVFPNLLKGRELTGINQAWATDITYIRITRVHLFLAAIIDVYSRKIIGWAISTSLDHKLCMAAIESAVKQRKPGVGCIHHSDRGAQYCSKSYVTFLKKHGFKISMSAKASPRENAFIESFFKTLKYEEIYLRDYDDENDVLHNVSKFIDQVYNKKRLHSGLGYLPPVEFEKKVAKQKLKNRPVQKVRS